MHQNKGTSTPYGHTLIHGLGPPVVSNGANHPQLPGAPSAIPGSIGVAGSPHLRPIETRSHVEQPQPQGADPLGMLKALASAASTPSSPTQAIADRMIKALIDGFVELLAEPIANRVAEKLLGRFEDMAPQFQAAIGQLIGEPVEYGAALIERVKAQGLVPPRERPPSMPVAPGAPYVGGLGKIEDFAKAAGFPVPPRVPMPPPEPGSVHAMYASLTGDILADDAVIQAFVTQRYLELQSMLAGLNDDRDLVPPEHYGPGSAVANVSSSPMTFVITAENGAERTLVCVSTAEMLKSDKGASVGLEDATFAGVPGERFQVKEGRGRWVVLGYWPAHLIRDYVRTFLETNKLPVVDTDPSQQ